MHPPSRQVGVARDLQRRLLSSDRDFTPEDYDMLLELDEYQGPKDGHHHCLQAKKLQALMMWLPVSGVPAGAAVQECIVCLEPMEPGTEVRTLPCMHVFHRACIEQWLGTASQPCCPIDQVSIDS